MDEIEKEEKEGLQDDADGVAQQKRVCPENHSQTDAAENVSHVQKGVDFQQTSQFQTVLNVPVFVGVEAAVPLSLDIAPSRQGGIHCTPDDGVNCHTPHKRMGREKACQETGKDRPDPPGEKPP
jgi:hypothetical protein